MHDLTPCLIPTRFKRHNRTLAAVLLGNQVWFSAKDLGRLMGVGLEERQLLKLDPDQYCEAWLGPGVVRQWRKHTMVSESGAFALLVHHYIPENRALRQWLTHEVIATLRGHAPLAMPATVPHPLALPTPERKHWWQQLL